MSRSPRSILRAIGNELRAPDDSGMAMITAILVSTIVLFLTMTSVALSDHSFSAQRVDRKRVQTFHAAEAGIDHALQVLQTTAVGSLPCASPLTASLGTGPYTADYSVTFTYWSTNPATGAAMSCPLASEPKVVFLSSVGDSSDPLGSRRRMEVTADLDIPINATAFNRSVFSEASITVVNQVTISEDATLFTNGDFACTNSQSLQGNLYAQGSISLANSCSVSNDVWAGTNVTLANNSSVGRDAIAGTGSVTMSGQANVRRNARAGTTITITNPATVNGLKIPNSPAGLPPTSTFPQVHWSALAWTSAGYTIRPYSDCALAASDLATASSSWTERTVVRVTGCRLDLRGDITTLANDLAIVSDWGIRFANKTIFRSVDAAQKQLHLIVPYGSTCDAATGQGNIELHNKSAIEPPIETFIYSPCTVMVTNQGVLRGQVYGGRVDFSNQTTLAYRPAHAVPGYTSAGTTTFARQVKVLYKREVVA